MISLAQLILDRVAAGADVFVEFAQLPEWQMELRWDELSPHCPSSMRPELMRRPGNALNIEIGEPAEELSWQRWDDNRTLSVFDFDEDDNANKVMRPCAEWIAQNGRGWLCGVNY